MVQPTKTKTMSKEVKPLVFGVNYKPPVSIEKIIPGVLLKELIEDHEKNLRILVQPIPDSVIITKKELEQRDRKMIADAWEAALVYIWEIQKSGKSTSPNKQQYIDSILNPKP